MTAERQFTETRLATAAVVAILGVTSILGLAAMVAYAWHLYQLLVLG
jgi:hypothetical protein